MGSLTKPRVLLVDNHLAIREGLRILLERRGIEVAGCTEGGAETTGMIERLRPDLALIDSDLPGGSVIHLVRQIRRGRQSLPVLLFIDYQSGRDISSLMEAGVEGLILKTSVIQQVVEAVRSVAAGRPYVDPAIDALRASADAEDAGDAILSNREREIFDMLAQDLSGEDIAEELVLSPETIRTHIRNAMRKLNARTRVGAVSTAVVRGEVDPLPRDVSDRT